MFASTYLHSVQKKLGSQRPSEKIDAPLDKRVERNVRIRLLHQVAAERPQIHPHERHGRNFRIDRGNFPLFKERREIVRQQLLQLDRMLRSVLVHFLRQPAAALMCDIEQLPVPVHDRMVRPSDQQQIRPHVPHQPLVEQLRHFAGVMVPFERCDEQRLFAAEMPKQRHFADSGRRGDLLRRRPVVPLFRDQVDRRQYQLVAGARRLVHESFLPLSFVSTYLHLIIHKSNRAVKPTTSTIFATIR